MATNQQNNRFQYHIKEMILLWCLAYCLSSLYSINIVFHQYGFKSTSAFLTVLIEISKLILVMCVFSVGKLMCNISLIGLRKKK